MDIDDPSTPTNGLCAAQKHKAGLKSALKTRGRGNTALTFCWHSPCKVPRARALVTNHALRTAMELA